MRQIHNFNGTLVTNYRYEQAFNYAIFIAYCCDIKQLR